MSAEIINLAERRPAKGPPELLVQRRKTLERIKARCHVLLRELEKEEADAAGVPDWNRMTGGDETLVQFCSRMSVRAFEHFNNNELASAHMCFDMATREIGRALGRMEERREDERRKKRDERAERKRQRERQREIDRMAREVSEMDTPAPAS